MRKAYRILVRASSAGAMVLLVGALLCLDGVDYNPYFRAPYYRQTIARLRVQAATNAPVRGELTAGFGRARLTPIVNAPQDDPARGQFRMLPLAGYGGRRGKPATGVHDDLYVKAVALRVGERLGVMVAVDALIIPREVTDLAMGRLEGELGLHREQVYLSATHSHSSLGGWGEGLFAEQFAGGFQNGARVWFAECLVAAIRQAISDLRPASFGSGSFDAPDFVRNRLVGRLGKVDPEFSYAVVKQREGKTAVLGSYAAHATVLSSDNMEFSADYPGCWENNIEQATGGFGLFFAGGVGSHSPNPGASGFAGAERMGKALGLRLLEHLPQTPLTNEVSFDLLGVEVFMPPLNPRLTDGIRLRPWLAGRILHAHPQSFIQAFRLDNSLWISTPCDFSGELALGIKDWLHVRGYHGVITSFNGDYIGYVVQSRYYHLDGYEPRVMSFFGPNVPDYFDELIRTLAEPLTNK
jgi:hypothetical protein